MSVVESSLEGRVALVTGASRKLGAEIAVALGRRRARVAVNYNASAAAAGEVVRAVKDAGGQAVAIQGDVADLNAIDRLVDHTLNAFGALDILVNNAGPYTDIPLASLPPAEWDGIMNTNLRAAYYAAQLAFRSMEARGWGRIVSISAGSAFVRNHSIYGLAKSALLALTESLALEFAPHVTVNAIAPGLIEDPALPEELKAAVREDTPLHLLVTNPQVAEMVCLLCSPAFDLVTGQVIVMDGGQTLPRGMTFENPE
jgi:NAD(P)-dependent dehydrogenase (short-subunit alcohol dehydrogenase family)